MAVQGGYLTARPPKRFSLLHRAKETRAADYHQRPSSPSDESGAVRPDLDPGSDRNRGLDPRGDGSSRARS